MSSPDLQQLTQQTTGVPDSLDVEALVRAIGVSPAGSQMLLVGAGASASSGAPTARQCIAEWKRELFLSANPQVPPEKVADVSLPAVRKRIQSWLDKRGGFPSDGDPDEYAFFVQETYPVESDRRTYFARRFQVAQPQVGYQLLSTLQNEGRFPVIWTTNFDGLIRRSRRPTHSREFLDIGHDCTSRLSALGDRGRGAAAVVHLHGDYRYDRLRNTSTETRALDAEMLSEMVSAVRQRSLIVLGYGGYDESVMSALDEAISVPSRGSSVTWCVVAGTTPCRRVTEFLLKAAANGYGGRLTEIASFDDVMVRIARYAARSSPLSNEVSEILSEAPPIQGRFEFRDCHPSGDWIKSNALRLELPREVYEFAADVKGWAGLRTLIAGTEIVAGLFKRRVLALADPGEIGRVFGQPALAEMELTPVSDADVAHEGTVMIGVMRDALARSIATAIKCSVSTDGVIFDPSKSTRQRVEGAVLSVFKGARLRITQVRRQHYLNVVPAVHVVRDDGGEISRFVRQEVSRRVFSRQWNRQYNSAIDYWRDVLLGRDRQREYHFPRPDSRFAFKICQPGAFARLLRRGRNADAARRRPHEVFDALVLSEPELRFATGRTATSMRDRHPIRGLLEHGPYELNLETGADAREVRVAAICPPSASRDCAAFLNSLNYPHQRVETKSNYLFDYPGFQNAYRLPMSVSAPGDSRWRSPSIPDLAGVSDEVGQDLIVKTLTREIEELRAIGGTDVAVIFVPREWERHERVIANAVALDLHDRVKAHAAQRGVRTQFLRATTQAKDQRCEVLWWLAHAIYCKSLRTPFVLSSDESETVFVGIGYGTAKRGSGVVLGCSHVFDASGRGLRYQLSRIKDPVWRGRNPFLSKEDALGIGVQTRQLFHETYQTLPKRVVVHKRTPFRKDEVEGLMLGLKGVESLDMLTVEVDPAWRFIAKNPRRREADSYPVRRGTVLLLDSRRFLLWAHGNVRGIKGGGKSYYQGGSRIPSPLRVTRFAGTAPIETLASELLGLTKMDWNTLDLYGRLPVTLQTSGKIARVGQLLSRVGPETYDYRLFM